MKCTCAWALRCRRRGYCTKLVIYVNIIQIVDLGTWSAAPHVNDEEKRGGEKKIIITITIITWRTARTKHRTNACTTFSHGWGGGQESSSDQDDGHLPPLQYSRVLTKRHRILWVAHAPWWPWYPSHRGYHIEIIEILKINRPERTTYRRIESRCCRDGQVRYDGIRVRQVHAV